MKIDFDSIPKKIALIYDSDSSVYSNETEKLLKVYSEVIKEFENGVWKYQKKPFDVYSKPSFQESNAFIWGELFFLLEKFEDYLFQMCNYYNNTYIDKLSNEDFEKISKFCFCFKAIFLKTTVLQKSIICLLKNGFVDSSLALWRSLFELEVISEIICKEPLEASEALYSYLDSITKENDYNWCKNISSFKSNKKKIPFTDLVDFVDIKRDGSDSRYNAYKNACNVLHISKRNLLCILGDYSDIDIKGKYVLQSSKGIDIVINYMSISMMRIYMSYFKYFDNINDNFRILNLFLCGIRDNIQKKINEVLVSKDTAMVYKEI